jgi:hypothetical protein
LKENENERKKSIIFPLGRCSFLCEKGKKKKRNNTTKNREKSRRQRVHSMVEKATLKVVSTVVRMRLSS